MGIGAQQPLNCGLMVGRVRQVCKSSPRVSQESALWGIRRQAHEIPDDLSHPVLPGGSQVLLDSVAHVAALLDTLTVIAQIIVAPGGVEGGNKGFWKQTVHRWEGDLDETQGRKPQRWKHSIDPLRGGKQHGEVSDSCIPEWGKDRE